MNRSVGAISAELSAAFVRARAILDLSVTQAADLAGISAASWTQIERRAARPTPEELCLMAKAAGLDPRLTLTQAGLDTTGLSLDTPLPHGPGSGDADNRRHIQSFFDELRHRRDQDPPFDN
jgi:transcriptional regulator with XRE-family HTH domain